MDNSPPAGNFIGRQRKMQQEQSLFPLLNGVALGMAEKSTKKKKDKEGEEAHTSKTTLASISSWSNSQSGSVYSRGSSYFSGRSDRSSSHLSSSLSFRSLSPCEPTCNPVPLYLRNTSGRTLSTGTKLRSRCGTSLPESIVEEDDDEEKAAGEGGEEESGKKKKKKRKKRRRRNTIVTSTGVSVGNSSGKK